MSEHDVLASRCRDIAERGVALGGAGNVSIRVGDTVLITRAGLRLERATAADMCALTLDGEQLSGARPSSETGLHLGIYRRSEARAIVHTHSRVSVAVGLVLDELPRVHYNIRRLGGRVPTVPYYVFGSAELADAVGDQVAAGHASVLMRNHGSVSCASSLAEAIEFTEMTDWLCDVYLTARQLGEPSVLSAEQLDEVAAQAARLDYGSA
ncbi:class II aldolase/adducin family protein [Cumulibacter soli]|uniref:class II aldolase/adducin family protein n=1 Tax=Cumulibacter soli TaxID=2546344 RepID=UPI001067D65B|nr:class II aldolase/adducin family protein [Cumulibacter soli]